MENKELIIAYFSVDCGCIDSVKKEIKGKTFTCVEDLADCAQKLGLVFNGYDTISDFCTALNFEDYPYNDWVAECYI